MPNEDVYCLVADDTHSFALHNGVIVHNCYDSARYKILTGGRRFVGNIKVTFPT